MTASIGDAFALATIAHAGMTYGDRPYIDHPIAVAGILIDAGIAHPDLIQAALLHDTVEDTNITLAFLRRFGYTDRVVDIVDRVTRRHGEVYMDFIRRAAADVDSRRVKMADNIHNRSTLDPADSRMGRYLRAWRILVDANGGVDLVGDVVEL